MAKAKRPSLSSSSSSSNPEELMKLLEEEEEEAFKIGIEAIIQQHLQTLNQSHNRIQKLLQTSLIQSYKRLGKIHEVENDHVVFYHSSDALQKDIKSSTQVAQNITTILKSILPRHTLDYLSDKERFFLANFSKSEDLKVSKFQKKTDFVRNKIVELAVKLYNLRTSRIKRFIVESVQYGQFRKKGGTPDSVDYIECVLWSNWWPLKEKEEIITITERDEIMMKIEESIKDLEGNLFGIYVMLQTQAAISAYAISEKSQTLAEKSQWYFGTGPHKDIESLAAAEEETKKTTTFSMQWFKSKIISFTDDIYYYGCLH